MTDGRSSPSSGSGREVGCSSSARRTGNARAVPLPGDGTIDEAPVAGVTYGAIHAFCRDSAALAALAKENTVTA